MKYGLVSFKGTGKEFKSFLQGMKQALNNNNQIQATLTINKSV